jgi:predicted methyltransferase
MPFVAAPGVTSRMMQTRQEPLPPVQVAVMEHQTRHRNALIEKWPIHVGAKVLEIGCGQGDCTEALAEAVGPEGQIDALDPAPLDYGSPETVGEAQARISASDIGSIITWHQKSPAEFLVATEPGTYDVVVICHSLWYHSSPASVKETLSMLKGKAEKLCIAEYALAATEPNAVPHVLAALTRASLETQNESSDANIRTAISPAAIREIAEAVGWKLVKAETVVPELSMQDGHWESTSVVSETFLQEIDQHVKNEKMKELLHSMRQAVKNALHALGGSNAQTMDVWVATFA